MSGYIVLRPLCLRAGMGGAWRLVCHHAVVTETHQCYEDVQLIDRSEVQRREQSADGLGGAGAGAGVCVVLAVPRCNGRFFMTALWPMLFSVRLARSPSVMFMYSK